jgi:hypothetical protein
LLVAGEHHVLTKTCNCSSNSTNQLIEKLQTLISLSGAEFKVSPSLSKEQRFHRIDSTESLVDIYDIAITGNLDSELSNALQERSRETEELFRAAKLPSSFSNDTALVVKCELLQAEVRPRVCAACSLFN